MGAYETGVRTVWRGVMRAVEGRVSQVAELGAAQPGAGSRSAPVLLVHGYGNNADSMGAIGRSLERDGFTVATLDLPNHGFGDARADAAVVGARVQELLAQTGASSIDIVGHSRGGVVARTAKQFGGDESSIGRVVTLSSANQGLHLGPLDRVLARLLPEGMQQIRRGASLIEDLRTTRPGHDLAAVGTKGIDGILVPASSAQIEGSVFSAVDEGRTFGPFSRVSHYGILTDDRAYESIRGALLAQ